MTLASAAISPLAHGEDHRVVVPKVGKQDRVLGLEGGPELCTVSAGKLHHVSYWPTMQLSRWFGGNARRYCAAADAPGATASSVCPPSPIR